VNITPIGHVESDYHDHDHTPVQASLNPEAAGVVVVRTDYAEGLAGLDGFDYAWLITWLSAEPADSALAADPGDGETTEPVPMTQVPFLGQGAGVATGIFAMRGPRRPNPLGLSLVRVTAVRDGRLHFRGVDVVDGTPVVDIKPFVAAFDDPGRSVRSGWFDDVPLPPGATPASLRNAR